MNIKIKTGLFFGIGMAFIFCTMSFISILKGEVETTSEIFKSFGTAFVAGLAAGVLAYFFSDKINIFGNKDK